jgi:hypothetical protein
METMIESIESGKINVQNSSLSLSVSYLKADTRGFRTRVCILVFSLYVSTLYGSYGSLF